MAWLAEGILLWGSSSAPQAWDGGGERNAWLGGAGEERERKCSSGGYDWKDIIEEEFINPRGFSWPG